MEERLCLECGKPFTKRKNTRMCSKKCNEQYWGDNHYEALLEIKRRYYHRHKLNIGIKARLQRETIGSRLSKLRHSHWARGGAPDDFDLTKHELQEIIKKYSTCPYCHANKSEEIDHILPFRHHKKTNKNNLIFCCYSCNGSKAGNYLQEWFVKKRCLDLDINMNTINPQVITQLEVIR